MVYIDQSHILISEFLNYIEGIVMDDRLVIVGDLCGFQSTNSNLRKMKDMLLSFNLIQHVLKPTHTSGHVCSGTIVLGVGTCVCQGWGDGAL